jgi:hypothetical protein
MRRNCGAVHQSNSHDIISLTRPRSCVYSSDASIDHGLSGESLVMGRPRHDQGSSSREIIIVRHYVVIPILPAQALLRLTIQSVPSWYSR